MGHERKRVVLLIGIMVAVTLVVGGLTLALLYRAALAEERARLIETAQSQARLLEAVARFNAVHSPDYAGGPAEATLAQIRDAHDNYAGFGETGEFTLAQLDGDQMVFLLSHRHFDHDLPQPVPLDSNWAEPMRRALAGQSGTVIGPDYRGERVLAAHEPVADLEWGIVAKIDLSEVRAPFVRAGVLAGLAAALVIALGAVLFVQVTEPLLHEMEDSERLFRTMFERAAVGMALIAPGGRFLRVNPQLCALLGYSPAELKERTFQGITPEEDRALGREYRRELFAGKIQTYRLEKRYQRKDGALLWVSVSVSLVRDRAGEPDYLISFVQDISQRKQAEDALQDYSHRLEEMVAERTRELQGAQEELVRKEKLAVLGQLAGGVGHELRNPLGVISNAIFFLKETLPEIGGKQQEYLALISAQVKVATGIVTDLLDFARTRTPRREDVQVREIVEQSLSKLPLSDGVQVRVDIQDALPALHVDPGHLAMVLDNLLTNALQAMVDGSAAAREDHTLGLSASAQESGMVTISISDTGMGINPEHAKKIFEPLFTTKARGIGLGLALTKNLVEANGGHIMVQSVVGEGSTFTVHLPVTDEES